MWKFLLKAWVLTEVFSRSINKQKSKYNQLVVEHLRQMDEQIAGHKELMRENNPFIVRAIADAIGTNLHIYSQEDINYILNGIYEEFPEEASKIGKLIDEMPGTPQSRGYGLDFV